MKQSLQTILWLTFGRYELTVSVTYRAFLRGFTRKISAFEAQVYAFDESARRYGTHLVLSRHTTRFAVWAYALCHSGTFFAGYPTNSNLHFSHLLGEFLPQFLSPSLNLSRVPSVSDSFSKNPDASAESFHRHKLHIKRVCQSFGYIFLSYLIVMQSIPGRARTNKKSYSFAVQILLHEF